MSVQVSFKKQMSFGILLLLCLLSAIEITARVYEFFYPYCGIIDKDAMNNIDWYTIRWICIDTNLIEFEWPDIQRYVPDQHLHTIDLNSHGFRNNEFSIEKTDNIYRIFVVGGSSTFGYGASSNEETIPGKLSNMFKNKNVEIINAGIGGATSFEEKYLIKNDILQMNPNLIIIFDGGNDVRYEQLESKNYSANQEKNPWKFKNYKFYRTPFVIWENFLRFSEKDTESIIYDPDKSIDNTISSNWEKNMREICNLGIKNDFKVIIFIQPLLGTDKILSEDESKMFYGEKEKLNQNLIQLENLVKTSQNLKSDCFAIHDLRSVFKNISEPVFFDDIHLNDFGNQMVAERIYKEIFSMVEKDMDI